MSTIAIPDVPLPDVDTYRETRQRIVALVSGLDPELAQTPVPSCPGWSVHDVIAHLAGIADDVLAGRMEGLGSAAWTGAQVDARREHTLEQVSAEWLRLADGFDRLLFAQPALGLAAAADAVIHEHDLRLALGRPGEQSSMGVRSTARRYAGIFADRVRKAGLGEVAVRTTDGEILVAAQRPVLTLEGPAFELMQALTGRRTCEEVLALGWSRDPGDVLEHLTPYGPLPAQSVAQPVS